MARNAPGEFIWYELMTTDLGAAAAFYGGVIGWSCQAVDAKDLRGYHVFKAQSQEVGGLMLLPTGQGRSEAAPGWIGYIGVEDVDRTATDLLANGAAQLAPPTDIPGIGRFAVVSDPQGAVFTLMRGAMDARSHAFAPGQMGHCQWNELSSPDPDAAYEFYSRHFRWTKGEAMPIGEQGVYQMLDHGGRSFGAVVRTRSREQRSSWAFYFSVPDIDEAASRVTDLGGELCRGPAEIPGGHFIIHALDPQGAAFALVGQRTLIHSPS